MRIVPGWMLGCVWMVVWACWAEMIGALLGVWGSTWCLRIVRTLFCGCVVCGWLFLVAYCLLAGMVVCWLVVVGVVCENCIVDASILFFCLCVFCLCVGLFVCVCCLRAHGGCLGMLSR